MTPAEYAAAALDQFRATLDTDPTPPHGTTRPGGILDHPEDVGVLARRVAGDILAGAVETGRLEWEDLPNLSEAEFDAVAATVTAIGESLCRGDGTRGAELWRKAAVEEPEPEPDLVRWVNITSDGRCSWENSTRSSADNDAVVMELDRTAVLEVNMTRRTVTWHDVDDDQ